jgi:hypothetical protein
MFHSESSTFQWPKEASISAGFWWWYIAFRTTELLNFIQHLCSKRGKQFFRNCICFRPQAKRWGRAYSVGPTLRWGCAYSIGPIRLSNLHSMRIASSSRSNCILYVGTLGNVKAVLNNPELYAWQDETCEWLWDITPVFYKHNFAYTKYCSPSILNSSKLLTSSI